MKHRLTILKPEFSDSLSHTLSVYFELTKPRLSLLVLFTTSGGYYLGTLGIEPFGLFFHVLFGTALVAGGANAVNQWMERDIDREMVRTKSRPLPAALLAPRKAILFAAALSVTGLLYLLFFTNALTALLGLLALASYVFLYTPLKRETSLSTLVGALPGALPIAMGWSAARGRLDLGACVLFSILFLWQLPHFLALGWRYRKDYEAAGLPILPAVDKSGYATGRQVTLYLLALLPVSLAPTLVGMTGVFYFFGALVFGLVYLVFGLRLAFWPSAEKALQLFRISIMYLTALAFLMLADKA